MDAESRPRGDTIITELSLFDNMVEVQGIDAYALMTGAVFDRGLYRYALWRFWNYRPVAEGTARAVMFVMGNPSTAGAHKDDPTIRKCAKYAQKWGYDGMYVGNLFGRIDTHFVPGAMTEAELIGADNDQWLQTMANSSLLHIAAWGFIGGYHPERVKAVVGMFGELYCLELSKEGIPKHPLYLSGYLTPEIKVTLP